MNRNYLKLGSYNTICDRCGQKYKRDECRFEWTGALTCVNCWDPRHPATIPLPIIQDGLGVTDCRPRHTDSFVTVPNDYMGIWGSSYKQLDGTFVSALVWGSWTGSWGGTSTDTWPTESQFL